MMLHKRLTFTPQSTAAQHVGFASFPGNPAPDAWQKMFYADDDSWLACDALLFNRDEVLERLGLDKQAGITNARLLYAGYKTWGDELPKHLNGEFTFVVWDKSRKRLLCGCDQMARRLLYWRKFDRFFVVSSSMDVVLAADDGAVAPNLRAIAELMFGLPRHAQDTCYERVYRLPAGTLLSLNGDHTIVQKKYFEFAKSKTPPDNPHEVFLDTYNKAVKRRLGKAGNVGCLLSGGLDSSSVAVLAAAQLDQRNDSLLTYTAAPAEHVPNFGNRVNDESSYVESVIAAHENIKQTYLPTNSRPVVENWAADFERLHMPVRNPENYAWLDEAVRLVRQKTVSGEANGILLNGILGNVTVSHAGPFFAMDYIRQSQYAALLKELWLRGGFLKTGFWMQLKGHFLAPLLSGRLLDGYARRNAKDVYASSLDVLNQNIVNKFDLHHCSPPALSYLGNSNLGTLDKGDAKDRHIHLLKNELLAGCEYFQSIRQHTGVELLDPTADFDVVKLCVSIPDSVYQQQGQTRMLIRVAMQGLLPDHVRLRTKYGVQSADWFSRLSREKSAVEKELARVKQNDWARDLVNLDELEKLYKKWPTQIHPEQDVYFDYSIKLLKGLHAAQFVDWMTRR